MRARHEKATTTSFTKTPAITLTPWPFLESSVPVASVSEGSLFRECAITDSVFGDGWRNSFIGIGAVLSRGSAGETDPAPKDGAGVET